MNALGVLERAASWAFRAMQLLPGGFEVQQDVPFGKAGGRTLYLDLLRPKRRGARPRPAVIYLFGGSWNSGSRDQGLLPMALLARRGFVTACIDYRLSREARFPAQVQDCLCAVRFLRARAGDFGVDPKRIALVGLSAGGHIAAIAALTSGRPEFEGDGGWAAFPSDVQAAITWSGPSNLLDLSRWHGSQMSPGTAQAALLGVAPGVDPQRAAYADPATYASAGAPPFLIVHGAEDRLVPPSQAVHLHKALQDAGVDARLLIVPGKKHAWLGLGALRQAVAFLKDKLT